MKNFNIQYVAKSLSVSPGRTLMGAAGLHTHKVTTSQSKVFLTGPLYQQQLVEMVLVLHRIPWLTVAGHAPKLKLYSAKQT